MTDSTIKQTPMMEQWTSCKKKAKDALLFFRLGDFYEAFYEDAQIISKELNLTLTKRQQIPMCGVPFHASEAYVDKLLAKGHKVAIAEQTEDPKQVKGLVKREVIRVITPGTVISSNLLGDKTNNFFISLAQIGATYGLCAIDLTTSEVRVIELEDKKNLIDELYRLKPSEILTSKKCKSSNENFFQELSYAFPFSLTLKEDWHFDLKLSIDLLTSHFKVHSLDGFGLQGMVSATIAAGALLSHLQEDLSLDIGHIQSIQTDSLSSYLSMDLSCMKNLELTESLLGKGKKNTLLDLLDKTSTPMGGRLLSHWIKHPLLSDQEIKKRQDAIEELLSNPSLLHAISTHLDQIRDLERLIMKISSGFASPRDLVCLRFSLEQVPLIKEILEPFRSEQIVENKIHLTETSSISEKIKIAIVDNPPLRISDGGIFKEGFHPELDELRVFSKNSKLWIANYQNTLREELQIKTLKVSFTKAFGYYIEVSKGQADKVPSSFHRRQTLVNGERFISDELKSFEHKILTSEEQMKGIETELYNHLREQIIEHTEEILQIAKAIAKIDLFTSLTKAAIAYNYTRPVIDNSNVIEIVDGRHPIIEAFLDGSKFIPNDTFLDTDKNSLFLITGPNMAGKSTYIRQVALIVIMAQIGSFVPAKSAHIGIVDKVFTRIGASDDLTRGHSTFMVEMTEAANILNNASSRSLVILDEIGRGTSTYDGIAIAWSVAEYLLTTQGKKARTLFATHFWELTELEKKISGAVNYHVAIKEIDSGIVFLRKIIKGSTDKSYGIHVAKLAGLPFAAIRKAEEMLSHLEKKAKTKQGQTAPSNQYLLFDLKPAAPSRFEGLQEAIKKLDLDQTTPLQAHQKILEWQKVLSQT